MLPKPSLLKLSNASYADFGGAGACNSYDMGPCYGTGSYSCAGGYTCTAHNGANCVDTSFLPCTTSLAVGAVGTGVIIGIIVT